MIQHDPVGRRKPTLGPYDRGEGRKAALRPLRRRLGRLRRRRRWFRRETAVSGLTIAVLWVLAGTFALDWYFQRHLDFWQRLSLLVFAAAAVMWAFVRFALPWLGSEDETEMALLVERQAGIDSDLVAALQFESGDAARWGSPQLQTAVIERVAARQKKIDVMAGMPRQPRSRRLKLLIASVAVWALLAFLVPQHVKVFFQRLAFGVQHYPSQTQVVEIKVNGTSVDLSGALGTPGPGEMAVHVPFGQAVRFEVSAEGESPLPAAWRLPSGPAARRQSCPSNRRMTAAASGCSRVAPMPVLISRPVAKVFLGDAWTDPLALSVTPLPAVEIEAEVVPPEYARQSADELRKLPRGMRQFPVLADSEVRFRLDSDRPLKAAEMTIDGKKYPLAREDRTSDAAAHSFNPEPTATATEVWTLPTAGTPLARVAKELRYSIQIRDVEGQTLDQPLQGLISLEPDQPPAIAATTKTTLVLPTGSPNIHYEATDDHALGRIWLTWEATTADADATRTDQGTLAASDHPAGDAAPAAEKRTGDMDIPLPKDPAPTDKRRRAGDYALPLKLLPLKPGDTLKVTFHVSDYRGSAKAETADADPPLVFQVTDLRGFEASMYDTDQKSAGALEDIRKKHTGQGETQ